MTKLDATHDPKLKSWVSSANEPSTDFPIQNLPFGVFTDKRNPSARVGVAIGDHILDLSVLEQMHLLEPAPGNPVFDRSSLNAFIGLGRDTWKRTRARISSLLSADNPALRESPLRDTVLVAQSDAQMQLPVEIPGYTDFYSSKEHATNVGSMFRDPANALMPNWLEIPIGYNGRASSVVVSGTPVQRPNGQLKPPSAERPVFGACRKLDIELETGFIIGKGNALGSPIGCEQAEDHIFGMVLLNDWSARDIQQWEYVPLGPFNAKTFATSISPWIVTMDALEPFRAAQPAQSPQPLEYLRHKGEHTFDIELEVRLAPQGTEPSTICRTNFKTMYWTMAQQLAHHTISGCNMRVGDLMGSGTISGSTPDSFGSLLELTWNGKNPLPVAGGATRTFLEDHDEVTLAGWCQGDGYRVGFGTCVGKILPAC
jgi:fumarylacetoacetase